MMKVYSRRQLMAKAPVPWRNQYLTFKALESGTFTLSQNAVSYSLDEGVTWNTLAAGTASPSVPAGKTIMWKGTITPSSTTGVGTFSATGSFNALGNAMSLLFGDNFARVKTLSNKTGAFFNLFLNNKKLVSAENLSLPALTMAFNGYRSMFQGCSNLVYPPALPATTLNNYCYWYMFYGCSSLLTAPELPAKNMVLQCYNYMFYGCSSLVTAPELPATTLANSCYNSMFRNCTSLKNPPALPAMKLQSSCYASMFQSCENLVTPPALPATTLASGCYGFMFEDCHNMTSAPELPATALVSSCYSYMFYRCYKINRIKAMFTTTPSTTYTNYWVNGVSGSGTFVKNSAAEWDVRGVHGIPNNWTVETASE
jgi:hypothetical protein